MRLYEVNQEIQRLLLLIEPDPETGVIPDNCDEILEQLNALTMKRSDILEYLAKVVLDIRADISALKAEEKRLKERRTVLEHKEERLMQILDRECAG
jgi:DNA-binding transcriptional MerR regulator